MIVFFGKHVDKNIFKQDAIKEYCTRNHLEVEPLKYDEKGKPFLDSVFISIAHTDDVVVVAFSQSNLGIDIELASRKTKIKMNITQWTAYEAYSKWKGTGILKDEIYTPFKTEGLLQTRLIHEKYILSIYSKDQDVIVETL